MIFWRFSLISILLFFSTPSLAFLGPEPNRKNLQETLNGAVTYLQARQILDRPGSQDCRFDYSGGNGCSGSSINKLGEWANDIYPLSFTSAIYDPETTNESTIIPDSNMFVTSAILYPLHWVDDSQGKLKMMRKTALGSIKTYRKGAAFSFWPAYNHVKTGHSVIGPVNLRFDAYDISDSFVTRLASGALGLVIPWVEDWMNQLMVKEENPHGFASYLNVPNDSDDTSVAMALLAVQAKKEGSSSQLDLGPLHEISRYRDVNRKKHDPRDTWSPKESGAFLTWMKNENEPLFADPETGVMPMGVNNVDCVVNANVVFSLALNGQTKAPGYDEALNYVADVALSGQWLKGCAFYYPQVYTFAYSASRAYRDGGARSPKMEEAMDQLMKDILKEQGFRGNWSISPDNSSDYATAKALVTLINLGQNRAMRLGLQDTYEESLKDGFAFLLEHQKSISLGKGNLQSEGFYWRPGLFFSATDARLGTWRSTAVTNATVVEAIAKYLSDYHLQDGNQLLFAPQTLTFKKPTPSSFPRQSDKDREDP
ncbi:MAG: hypothetical protein AAF203_02505 [Pseudomonadota bacterium]